MRITKNEVVYSTPFLNMNQTTFLDNKNEEKKWWWVERTNIRKAVMIVPFIITKYIGHEWINKILMIKEKRIPLNDFEYGFPAGLIDGNESIEIAANRELIEETGYKIDKVLRVSPFVYNSAGLTNESISIMFAEVSKFSEPKLESTEEIQTLALYKQEIQSLLEDAKRNEIKIGAKAWIILDSLINYNQMF